MKKAFTLTEILIAISVIGIIAVLTIPNLATDTSNQTYKYVFKSTFNTFQEGLISAENVKRRPIIKVGEDSGTLAATKQDLSKFLRSNFSASESNRTNIASDELSADDKEAIYRLKNGVQIIFPKAALNKMKSTGNGCTNLDPCVFYIDVNGKKGPNEIINCTEGTTADTPTNESCFVSEDVFADIYPLWLKGSYISPKSNAVEYVLSR